MHHTTVWHFFFETLHRIYKNMKMGLNFVVRERGGNFEHLINWWKASTSELSVQVQYSYKSSTEQRDLWVLKTAVFVSTPCISRRGSQDTILIDILHNSLVKVLPGVSVSGDRAPPLFAFTGGKMLYHEIILGGVRILYTLTNYLPLHAMASMRKGNGEINSRNFLSWAKMFVQYARSLTTGCHKILLMYDGYRAHMT